jgi:hypothetical protein
MTIEGVVRDFWLLYSQWGGHLVNPNLIRAGCMITWPNFSGSRLPKLEDVGGLIRLAEDRQYSFQHATDGGLFRLFYEFDAFGHELRGACLSYATTLPLTEVFEESDRRDTETVAWVRLDYDEGRALGMLHPACHLHLSAFPGRRLVVRHVPTPSQFVEFVISYLYPTLFRRACLDESGQYSDHNRASRLGIPLMRMPDDYASSAMSHFCVHDSG